MIPLLLQGALVLVVLSAVYGVLGLSLHLRRRRHGTVCSCASSGDGPDTAEGCRGCGGEKGSSLDKQANPPAPADRDRS